MSIRPILQLPDKRLRLVSEPVAAIDGEVKKLVADMFETMYEAPGVGLAAVQVGVPKRVVTIDATRGEEEKRPFAMINPEILWTSDEKSVLEEGCLSIPSTAGRSRSRPRDCSPVCCSMRSIISTASSSSTIFPS